MVGWTKHLRLGGHVHPHVPPLPSMWEAAYYPRKRETRISMGDSLFKNEKRKITNKLKHGWTGLASRGPENSVCGLFGPGCPCRCWVPLAQALQEALILGTQAKGA